MNQVVHQKAEVLTKNISSLLIKEAVDTVESYQGLLILLLFDVQLDSLYFQ
jgi:hypothetical protein